MLSWFLDNIAAAMIGGAIAREVFRSKVHIGYLAAIVAASNAGGAGSVVGDTTTTMMWIAGVNPLTWSRPTWRRRRLVHIRHSGRDPAAPVLADQKDAPAGTRSIGAASSSCSHPDRRDHCQHIVNLRLPGHADGFPFIGVAVWVHAPGHDAMAQARLEGGAGGVQGHDLPALAGTCASLMPVEKLPAASWQTALGLGFVSAVFDNIPLTALALKQGGYDWGFLAYAVGFGGSMIWFGSSAGVALSNMYPEAKSVGLWLRHGWHIAVAYVIGFFFMLALIGWHPDAPLKCPRR